MSNITDNILKDHAQRDFAIEAKSLNKSFGKKQVLSGLDFSLGTSSITGLLGRNGAGKTTLMKMCAGHIAKGPNGTLKVLGANPFNNLTVLSKLIYSCHDLSYSGGLKLKTILSDYNALFPTFELSFAEGLLSYFDLDTDARYVGLSQGDKSTFNFICALAARTPLTMLDEPTLGMDITVRKAAYEILMREYSEHPRTFIIASHLISEVENVLDDVLILDDGKIALHASIENMRQSAYQIQGDKTAIEAFVTGKKVIHKDFAETLSTVVIYEPATEATAQEAHSAHLRLSAVRPEDLYVYLTHERKGGDLECLW